MYQLHLVFTKMSCPLPPFLLVCQQLCWGNFSGGDCASLRGRETSCTDKRRCRSGQDAGWSVEISQESVRDGAFCLGEGEEDGTELKRSLSQGLQPEGRPSGGFAEEEQPEFCKEDFSVTR